MITTIKISEDTKKRLSSLDLAEKGKTFDMIVNELVTNYKNVNKKYEKDYKKWEKEMKEYEKTKNTWKKLLNWAKSKGFKS